MRDRGTLISGLFALVVLAGVAAADSPDARPTRVSAALYVVDVAEVDDARRTFTGDVYLLLRWKEARPAGKRVVPLNAIWHPVVQVLNQRNVSRLLPEVATVDGDGNVEYRQRFQGAFSIRLDLRRFPFDAQALAVRFVSPGQAPAELEYVVDERGGRAADFSILDWDISEPTTRVEPLTLPDGRQIAGLTCDLPARRRSWAYVYQFVVPLSFIVCMSWAAFWMAREQFVPRQGIAVTSMLTVIAYRFVLASQLPRVAYLTRLDYLLLGCTALVFLVLVEVLIVHRLMTHERPDWARRLDRVARGIFPAAFLVLLLTTLAL